MFHSIENDITEFICNELIANIPSHTLRIFLYKKIGKVIIGKNSSIGMHTKLRVPSKIKIGHNVAINQECYLDARGGIEIMNNVNLGKGTQLITGSHDYNDPLFSYNTKKIIIFDHAWITTNVIILPGVIISEGSVIGAGSIVTKNTKEYTVMAGNPAKLIASRNRNVKYKTNYFKFLY